MSVEGGQKKKAEKGEEEVGGRRVSFHHRKMKSWLGLAGMEEVRQNQQARPPEQS